MSENTTDKLIEYECVDRIFVENVGAVARPKSRIETTDHSDIELREAEVVLGCPVIPAGSRVLLRATVFQGPFVTWRGRQLRIVRLDQVEAIGRTNS